MELYSMIEDINIFLYLHVEDIFLGHFFHFKHRFAAQHFVKSVRIQSFSGPYFPYSVLMQEIRTRKTPNTVTFHIV